MMEGKCDTVLHGDGLVAIVTFFLFIATVTSVWVAWRLGRNQEILQRKLADEAGERARQQRIYEQRTQILPLWSYISALSDIDPKPENTVIPDVVKAVNALEIVSLCCDAQVIDRAVVMKTFRDAFIDFYEKIERCGPLIGYDSSITGKQLLERNSSTVKLYKAIKEEYFSRDNIAPIG